jgi:hypothetical protein
MKEEENMTRKLTAGVVLLAALVVASVTAGCGSANSKAALPRVLRFLVIDESTFGLVRQRPRPGDQFIFTTGVYNRGAQLSQPSGKRVGGGTALCTVAAPGGKAVFCTGAIQLPGGYVVLANFFPFGRKVNSGVVVGGVGAYAGARGTATFTVLERNPNTGEKNSLVLRLTP